MIHDYERIQIERQAYIMNVIHTILIQVLLRVETITTFCYKGRTE